MIEKIKVFISTGNKNKFEEYKKASERYPGTFELFQVDNDRPEPFLTTMENAIHKSDSITLDDRCVYISDDTDFCLTGLNNQPGVFIKRFMNGFPSENDCLQYMINKVDKIKDRRFSTKTTCCVSYSKNGLDSFEIFEQIGFGTINNVISDSGFSFDKICTYEKKNNREQLSNDIFEFLKTNL